MYSSSQRALHGMRGLGQGTAVGAAAGTAILGPGAGTAIGGLIGGLFGGHPSVQNPSGPAAFARWAQEGHFDWVAQVAINKAGPDWSRDPGDTGQPWKTGYSPADAASATQILAQYGMTPQAAINRSSTSSAISIPQNAVAGINQPVTVTLPAGTQGARTNSILNIAGEVSAVLTYVRQGQSLPQAIQTAVNNREIDPNDAAAVSALAGQVANGATKVQYGAAGLATGINLAGLASNPLVLVGGAGLLYLLLSRRR